MEAGKQGLTSIVEAEGVAIFAGNHVTGFKIRDIHVVATDQIRRLGALNLVKGPMGK